MSSAPLVRAERYLQVRLTALERRLPVDGDDSPLWTEYVGVVDVLARVRAQLYPTTPTMSGQRARTREGAV